MERSKNDSSREDTFSHVRHRVSLVSIPSNIWCMNVDPMDGPPELEVLAVITNGCDVVDDDLTE